MLLFRPPAVIPTGCHWVNSRGSVLFRPPAAQALLLTHNQGVHLPGHQHLLTDKALLLLQICEELNYTVAAVQQDIRRQTFTYRAALFTNLENILHGVLHRLDAWGFTVDPEEAE